MTDRRPLPRDLTTKRLSLGPWLAEDVDAYAAMIAERDRRTPAAPRTAPTREQLLESIARQQAALESTGICLYVIRVEDEFAGYCGIVVGRSTLDEPEIGYELPQRFPAGATRPRRRVLSSPPLPAPAAIASGRPCVTGMPRRFAF